MINHTELSRLHNKNIIVKNNPYSHAFIKNFLPDKLIKIISQKFIFPNEDLLTKDALFQKTKRALGVYSKLPSEIQKLIDYLNSDTFLKILEKKFNIKNLISDPSLFGGGMHESRNGGYLKIHSDFIYMRNKNLKRRLNVLIYLNDNWKKEWGGALELWDQQMNNNFLKIFPNINHCVIFRTDTESNHGFPDPIKCPSNIGRKSIAVYYYTKDHSFFKRTKYFYARWKRRPGIDEPKFGDNRNIFERIKNQISFRF